MVTSWENGDFKRFFDSHPATAAAAARIGVAGRRVLDIANPQLSPATRAALARFKIER